MGLFDAFTGAPAKKAAAENSMRLGQLQTDGINYLDAGRMGALASLDSAKGYYDPLKALGAKYGSGTDLYIDSLGVNGADGNARATAAFQAGPGYQWNVERSLDALDRRASSRGQLASGNNTNDTLETVHGLNNQEYSGWQNRLAGLISPELSATSGAATGLAGLDAMRAPIYTNDATSRVGLASGVAGGQNNQTTQAANAQMAGNANMWGLGLNVAKLAAGGVPSTNMLGGGGTTTMPGAGGGGGWFGGGTTYSGDPSFPGFGQYRGT